jgi:hypothetical protein
MGGKQCADIIFSYFIGEIPHIHFRVHICNFQASPPHLLLSDTQFFGVIITIEY